MFNVSRLTRGLLIAVLATGAVFGLLLAFTVSPASASITGVPSQTPRNTWGTNGRVLAILPAGNRVYVAGDFTSVVDLSGQSHPIRYLAAFNPGTGSFDLNWTPNPNARVSALALGNGQLYIGGKFTAVHGHSRARLAALNATTGQLNTTWTPGANRPVKALDTGGGFVYIGGKFTELRDRSGQRHSGYNYLGRVDATTGNVSLGWHPRPNDIVRSVVVSSGGSQVYVGGDFTSISGDSRAHSIASLTAATGNPTPGFVSGPTNQNDRPKAFHLSLDGTRLLAGVGGAGGGCASLNATTGATQWNVHANGNVQAVTGMGGAAYCGGHFGPTSGGTATFGGQTRYKLAAVDESTGRVLGWAPRVNSSLGVWSLADQNGALYVGGDFTRITGKAQPHFAVMQ